MAAADAPAPPPATVLVVSEARGFVHDSIPAAQRALVALGPGLGVRVRLLASGRELTAARLRGTGAVVFLDTTGDVPLGAGGRERVLRFARRGGGVVALHAATNGFPGWAAWPSLVGARFVSHPPLREDEVTVRADASTRGVPRRFRALDELYVHDRARPGRVVARLATGDRRALVWRRSSGRGRVFTSTLGHPDEAWAARDPRLLLARAGLRWTLRR